MILELLDALLLQPLLRIYSDLYSLLPWSWEAGQRILGFSLIVNTLLLPIYVQMEGHSRRLRAIQKQVGRDVARWRQHVCHLLAQVGGSADLCLQILVFVTVYRFLSGLDSLQGAPFGPIGDLSRPDALLGGINLLPLVTTAASAASVLAYEGDARRRLQLLMLATAFLIVLYRGPAGFVLYWTVASVFSLARSAAAARGAPKLPHRLATAVAAVAGQR